MLEDYFEISFHCKNVTVIILSVCTQRCYGRHNVSRKSLKSVCDGYANLDGLSILLHDVI